MKKRLLAAMLLFSALILLLPNRAMALGSVKREQFDTSLLAPTGLLLDGDGTITVVDAGLNNIISRSAGIETLIAGKTLPYDGSGRAAGGFQNGPTELALFNAPFTAVRWLDGLVVSDRGNHCLRLVRDGWVYTLAGSGKEGHIDGSATTARFSAPSGLAVDEKAGILYIADSGNGCIRAINTKGEVSTYATGLGEPMGLFWHRGALYVTDTFGHRVLRVEGGKTTTLAGNPQPDGDAMLGGFLDGPADRARFSYPMGVTVSGDTVYVADTGNSAIRAVQNGWVSTLACYSGSQDGLLPASPTGIQSYENRLYIADSFAGAVLSMDADGQLFGDVPVDSWFASSAGYVYTAGIMNAFPGSDFGPDEVVTRGQAVSVLYEMSEKPAAGESPFDDIPEGHPYARSAAWAANRGLVERVDGSFGPDEPLTREELAVLLYRLAGEAYPALQVAQLTDFWDEETISQSARPAMEWACGHGLLLGNHNKRLEPKSAVSRGQLAVVLTRLLSEYVP